MTDDRTVYDDGTVYEGNDDGTVYEGLDDNTVYETDGTVYEEETTSTKVSTSGGGFAKGSLLLDTYLVESDPIQGGMGSIWRVHHQNWDTDLAMKRPKKEFFETDKQKDAFIRECDSWINLGLHPNIVSCYYVREIEGVPTIFSEWMTGGSLESKIQDRSLYEGSEEEVKKRLLDIAIQFARGLNYAHEKGLIHQDVKPDNVLLDSEWDAKVSDFGLAKARSLITILEGEWTVREDEPVGTIVTPSGGMTPSYCSPEQSCSQPLTRRTDIYSWAVSILEMYLGDKPWMHGRELTGPMVGSACDVYFEMCRISIPDRLKGLLARCLAYDPDDRYHDFTEVESALKEIYRLETGEDYLRSIPEAASDTADSLNNRALSFLDLGKTDEALLLWDTALKTDNRNFRAHYNRAVTLWKNNQINADELYASVYDRQEDSEDWRKASEAVSFAKVITYDDIKYSLVKEMNRADPSKNTFTREDIANQARLDGIAIPEEPMYQFENWRIYWQEKKYDENGIYDRSRDGRRTISYDWEAAEYVVAEKDAEYRFKSTPPDKVGGGWKFLDGSGEILTTHGYDVHFISAATGRSLLIFHSDRDWDDDVIFDHIMSVSENGFVQLEKSDTMRSKRWIKLPPADPKVDYILSRIESFSERDDALKQLQLDYYEALRYMEGEDYEEVLDILAPSLENGTLLQFEPALRLWEKLYRYCEPGKLVTVIPSDSLWRPVKQDATWIDDNPPEGFEWMLNTYDGDDFFLTAVESYSMSENYHDTIDYDFTYSLKAEDMETGDVIFTAEKLTTDSQDDEDVIDYGLWMILDGTQLWYKKTAWPYSGAVNLIDPETQRKIGLKLALPGEGAYFLQNTDNGVDIGGFTFDDEYFGIAPLIDAQVVQCQKRAYRLIYQYKGLRDE
ncbi:Serine/threonine protein kinase [Lachnospiraceae bacterium NE2001]|nr:Serine/threonine protein kinase [Lachnospiraceae bacterium NE2001]